MSLYTRNWPTNFLGYLLNCAATGIELLVLYRHTASTGHSTQTPPLCSVYTRPPRRLTGGGGVARAY